MEFWVEDSNWRKFGSQQGRDDWDFYREKFGQSFSRWISTSGPVDWDLGPFKDVSSYRHSDSHFRIKKSLHADEWQYLMQILARIDVSQIEHMEFELLLTPAHFESYDKEAIGMDHLGPVLGSGRFLALKTLRIKIFSGIQRNYRVGAHLGYKASAYLAKALQSGRFTNLRILSLPHCNVSAILWGLEAGSISHLRSFSILSGFDVEKSDSDKLGTSKEEVSLPSQNLGAFLGSGCFKSLQHLALSYCRQYMQDDFLWEGFIHALESGKVPNLKSLGLTKNRSFKLADLVPFLVSTPLENLTMDGCEISSSEVERFRDAIMHLGARSALALKRLDLHNNNLDGRAVSALVRLACSDKLAQLEELDLSMNSGLDSSALKSLMESIQSGHYPSFKLLIWSKNRDSDAPATEAFVRLHDENNGLADEWYQVLYRPQHVRPFAGLLQTNVTHYSVKKIQLKDLKRQVVDWDQQTSGYGAGFRIEKFGTTLESSGCSTVEVLRLKNTSAKSYNPELLSQGQHGWAHLAASLRTGQFTSLLTRSLPAGGVTVLTLKCDVSAILGALNSNCVSHLRAFSILSTDGLDDLSRSSLYQKLDSALKGGFLKSLQRLELCSEVLDGGDGWEGFTQAIKSGSLESILSVRIRKNVLADVGPLLMFDFPKCLMVMDGCWINSKQVWGLVTAIINDPVIRFSLEELKLCNGALDKVDGWKVLTRAIKSGKLSNITTLRLSKNAFNRVNLEELLPLILSDSFENLIMDNCFINSEQVWTLANALMNCPRTALALKSLNLHGNVLSNRAVVALVKLANSGMLPQLQVLDLGMNRGIDVGGLKSLTETIRRGHLCCLNELIWIGNPGGDAVAEAMVEALETKEDLRMTFDIDWTRVSDPALKIQVKELMNRNNRLWFLKQVHPEVLEDVVPLTFAKIFLCGFPEVGKTTLRSALTHLTLEINPHKKGRTRGIELSQLEERNLTLVLWDIAGQEEYRVLHGTFFPDLGLSSGKATIFVLVLRASFKKSAEVEKDLLYWFRFIASSSQKRVRRHVVIVLNCFDGQQCAKAHMNLWMILIKRFEELFRGFLHIHLVPFSLDVRLSTSVQPLKDYLFDQAQKLLQNITVPKVCLQLQQELKRWAEGDNSHIPILSWEAFEKHVNLKLKENQLSGKNLKAAALYLHEIGGIVYFDRKESTDSGSKNRSVVVLNPEWFCRQVVGELLLPEEMLEEGCSLIVNVDGLIPIYRFQCHFEELLVEGIQSGDIISMLERVGLCYRKGNSFILVPALIKKDDDSLITEWEDGGSHLVIGRCLATEDHERTAIPMTLFRRLQVELAQDPNFGGREDSGYRAGKFSSTFNVGELSFLIEVDANPSNPNDDRIDILAKTVDLTKESSSQVDPVCKIIEKLQVLCTKCCPGLKYAIKVIKPWGATEKTPKMPERQLMSLREIKNLVMDDKQKSSWRVSGNAVELKNFLSDSEMKEVLQIKNLMNAGSDIGTAGAHVSQGAVEETERTDYSYDSEYPEGSVEETEWTDYYYDSDYSEGSEDFEVSLDGVEGSQIPDVSSQAVEESEHALGTKDDHIGGCGKEDSLPKVKGAEQGNSYNALLLDKQGPSVKHQNNDLQRPTLDISSAQFAELKDLIIETSSHLGKAVHRESCAIRQDIGEGNRNLLLHIHGEGDATRQHSDCANRDLLLNVHGEGHAIRQHIDEGNKNLLLNADKGRNEVLSKIQTHHSFSIAEKENSVPRFLLLKKKDSSEFWTSFKDNVKGLFRKYYRLHFLCESQFDDGNLHWVKDQEGLKLSKNTVATDWLKRVEPWVRWSYFVATTVAKIALTVLAPGTAGVIPPMSTSTEVHDKARNTAVRMLHDEDEIIRHGNPGGLDEQLTDVKERLILHGNVGTSDQLTDVKVKSIAQGIVSDLIKEFGWGPFSKGTRLKRVLLKAMPHHHIGSSQQARSVLWICVDCFEKYSEDGEGRATDITPLT